MSVEARRGCGYRKAGGIYLMGDGGGLSCDRLPLALTVCPTCSAGIKQSRGWTWIDVFGLVGGDHPACTDEFPCPLCMATRDMGKAGLLWIGERFYPTVEDFMEEANRLGISRRISAVPRGFKLGETWVLLAHPKGKLCAYCNASGLDPEQNWEPCPKCLGARKVPGIFRVFQPRTIEKIVTETQAQDSEAMDDLRKRGITPVIVPDSDKDHQGSVFDREKEEENGNGHI